MRYYIQRRPGEALAHTIRSHDGVTLCNVPRRGMQLTNLEDGPLCPDCEDIYTKIAAKFANHPLDPRLTLTTYLKEREDEPT